jgi:hypothetical protein
MAKKTSNAAMKPPATGTRGRVLAVHEALNALQRLQRLSVRRGLDALTDEEIEAEIRAVRAKRRRS